ncbi:MAG TPA: glycosyltransferase family 1 protein, partial [Acidimicrobiales bacterium]|nr:glycosyltransferase family 1 protein [Acidimicrobiales bacterium]
ALDGVAQRAARVITGSQAAKAEIVANSAVPLERVRVVANGVDHRLATQDEVAGALRRHDLEGAPYVLWVGSLEPRKNVATLVRAFARLAAGRQVPHRLVLVGPLGWLHDELVPQEPARQLGDRLRTLGAVSDRDLRALYAGASLFAFPSLHEGFGMPVLEAMAQRTPVVCSDIAALAEVSGGSAVLVPPCDVEAWASALGELASDEAGRVTLGAAGFDWAAQFTWERMAQQTYAIYQEVAGTSHE